MKNKFKAIIVDDEKYARKELSYLLEPFPEIEIVGQTSTIKETVKLIDVENPDIVFLDIQLAGETGFDLFDKLDKINFNTIFITAFEEYAVRAFEINALDYLLKPVHPGRLKESIDRIKKNISPQVPKSQFEYDDKIFLKTKKFSKFFPVQNISFIKSEKEYSRIFFNDGFEHLIYKSLNNWERILPIKHFLRIHRSTIINLNYVNQVEKQKPNGLKIFQENFDSPLEVSRRSISKLKEKIPFSINQN